MTPKPATELQILSRQEQMEARRAAFRRDVWPKVHAALPPLVTLKQLAEAMDRARKDHLRGNGL